MTGTWSGIKETPPRSPPTCVTFGGADPSHGTHLCLLGRAAATRPTPNREEGGAGGWFIGLDPTQESEGGTTRGLNEGLKCAQLKTAISLQLFQGISTVCNNPIASIILILMGEMEEGDSPSSIPDIAEGEMSPLPRLNDWK